MPRASTPTASMRATYGPAADDLWATVGRPDSARRGRPSSAGRSRGSSGAHAAAAATGGGEWALATHRLLVTVASDKARSGAVRADSRAVSNRAATETARYTKTVQGLLERKLLQTRALQHKLQRAIQNVVDEIAQLDRAREKSVVAFNSRQAPLDLARQRLRVRRTRPRRENMEDEAQRALRLEDEDLCRSVQQLGDDVRHMDALMEQLVSNKRTLELDLADKDRALALDTGCLELPARSQKSDASHGSLRDRLDSTLRFADALLTEPGGDAGAGEVRMLATTSSTRHPVEWREATHRNTRAAAELVTTSQSLRKAAAERIRRLQQTNAQCHDRVRRSLAEKMRATAALHSNLSEQIKGVTAEISRLEKDRRQLEAALREKELPFQQCVERLSIRRGRPSREAAADEVERELKDQLNAMAKGIHWLEQAHDQIVTRQADLRKLWKQMQLDRADKAAALQVDKEAFSSTPHARGQRSAAQPSQALFEQTFVSGE
eukprot:TRINITY_DN50712_c0_g1_i1.p1 TRINITY_DN50712_c0_g1~~TRINITY_DN50712_c0_g1_i1.p1  ORF type:complete len:494 (+),score=124.79 TRINITY_DN50712_c0_g1_i1:82-1563(+)